jgi:hypothetical protein
MILDLNDPFFAKDPLEVYEKYNVNQDEWKQIWYHKKFLEYTLEELLEYVKVVLKKENLTRKHLYRFLMRYEIYLKTQALIKRNEQTIHINFYPENAKSFIKDYYHGK